MGSRNEITEVFGLFYLIITRLRKGCKKLQSLYWYDIPDMVYLGSLHEYSPQGDQHLLQLQQADARNVQWHLPLLCRSRKIH